MAIKTKKVSEKHSRKADRRRRPGSRRPAARRMDEGEVTTTASPYREYQRDYSSALWL